MNDVYVNVTWTREYYMKHQALEPGDALATDCGAAAVPWIDPRHRAAGSIPEIYKF